MINKLILYSNVILGSLILFGFGLGIFQFYGLINKFIGLILIVIAIMNLSFYYPYIFKGDKNNG